MEIGSEFEWSYINRLEWLPHGEDTIFTFSGRTAIETALKNIKCKRTALVPSYCCESMLIPFRDLNVKLDFFEVKNKDDGIQIIIDKENLMKQDVLFLCNYFGFRIDFPDDLIKTFQDRGGVVIEDITHSLLSKKLWYTDSDYWVASLRKWGDLLDGGYCNSRKRKLYFKPLHKPKNSFIEKKIQAMKLKRLYLEGNKVDKNIYQSMFAECNSFLAKNYQDTLMTEVSYFLINQWNTLDIRTKRINNAKILYAGLRDLENIEPLFLEERMDCPLFVPVIIKRKYRDTIRKKLIENQIYCPVHWPKPAVECTLELYDIELSLVCDQRYERKDMNRILSVLKQF